MSRATKGEAGKTPLVASRGTRADRDRLVLFGNSWSFVSNVLIAAALAAAPERGDMEVVAVCDTAPNSPPRALVSAGRWLLTGLVRRLFDRNHPILLAPPMLMSLAGVAHRARVPFLVAPGRDINDPVFVRRLRDEYRPTLALSLESVQIFRRELLACFEVAVNYHNGRLPDFRGRGCTAWSLYEGDAESGFAFHRMDAGIDTGAVLLAGCVPVSPGARRLRVEWDKARTAAAMLPKVLGALHSREEGTPQAGPSRYFSVAHSGRATMVGDPAALTAVELERRLRAFDVVDMRIAGRTWAVTRLRVARTGSRAAFTTSDGLALEPARCQYLPLPLFRLLRRWWSR